MLDLLITNAALPDGRTGMSVAVQDGRITAVEPALNAPPIRWSMQVATCSVRPL